MSVIKLASELGEKIAADERVEKLKTAQKRYENDPTLQRLVQEYSVQRTALAEEYKGDTQDNEAIAAINERLEKLQSEIVSKEIYISFAQAKEDMDKLLQDVNAEISRAIFGESDCSSGCDSCKGCSH